MSGQDLIVIRNQDGIGEAEFPDAGRDLGQLFAGVPSVISTASATVMSRIAQGGLKDRSEGASG